MKPPSPRLPGWTLAVLTVCCCLSLSAFPLAQKGGGHGGGGHSGGGGHAGGGGHSAAGGHSSGGTSGGGSGGSAGRAGSGNTGSGAHVGAGARHAATGASGTDATTVNAVDNGAPRGRPRGSAPVVGTAVPRGTVPSTGGTTAVIVSGYGVAPWYFAGLGLGGYYGGYLGAYGGGYGAYAGGYYDPWFGAYPGYSPGYGPGYGLDYGDPQAPPVYGRREDEGSLHLKIKPRQAEVYVDGYYVGIVNDFNGMFHRLHVESGDHRIEVRASGYETLSFDVRVQPGRTTTYQGELKRIP
jgi:hypothetical protein